MPAPSLAALATQNVAGRWLSPAQLALRNWWSATDYNAATGNWVAKAGSRSDTLVQATAGKRPAKSSSNALFGNLPTVNGDGVDDDLKVASALAMSIQPNTLGILCRWAGGAASYLVGQYASSSYQFYRMDGGSDQIYADPNFPSGYTGVGIAGVHLWLFSKVGTAVTLYKDAVNMGTKTMNSSSGTGNDFYLFSAGSGYTNAEVGELFTIDGACTQAQATALTGFFRGGGYPLA
jgi:hypothetical protein